jgi:peroxiredoxin
LTGKGPAMTKADISYRSRVGIYFLVFWAAVLSCNVGVKGIELKTPPYFELTDAEGHLYKLKDDLGSSTLILFFWTTCCPASLKELPHINAINEKYMDKGLKCCAINVDDASSSTHAKPTMKRYGYKMTLLLDPTNEIFRKFSPSKIKPYVVIIGKSGEIIDEFPGYKPGDEIRIEDDIRRDLDR